MSSPTDEYKNDFINGFLENPDIYKITSSKAWGEYYLEVCGGKGPSFFKKIDGRLLDDPLFDRVNFIKNHFEYIRKIQPNLTGE